MLAPNDRQLLGEALRPPAGYRFDRAVSTTFTLDLLTLLTMPVAFTLFKWPDAEGRPRTDPLALLEAVRRHASHIHVFCQAGRIAVPKNSQLLFSYLEDSVIEVTAPKGGVFHPKLTVLRFVAEPPTDDEGQIPVEEGAVFYRLLNASRNLTFDRSWDTLLILEGELAQSRKTAIARNRPLGEFVTALPGMTLRPIGESTARAINQIADELLRVRFEEPEGFESLKFWPIGHVIDEELWPFETRTDRIVAIAPFVDDKFIEWIGAQTDEFNLVSRVEALDRLSATALDTCDTSYVMSDATEMEEDDLSVEEATVASNDSEDGVELIPSEHTLRGLHAKVFVADAGHYAKIWTGSANATRAAFENNVEFLVEMTSTRKICGVQSLLRTVGDHDNADDQNLRFGDLLVTYQRDESEPPLDDSVQQKLESLIEQARQALVEAKLLVDVQVREDIEPDRFDLAVRSQSSNSLRLPDGTAIALRPISLRSEMAVPVSLIKPELARFENLSFEAVTSFVAFEVMAKADQATLTSGFVFNLPMQGAPSDRSNRLLLALLSNRQRLLRYLLMLLADTEIDPRTLIGGDGHKRDGTGSADHGDEIGLPLLEPLLRTLANRPDRLDRVASLINDLRSTEEGRKIVPDTFMAIWDPIWRARLETAGV